MLTAVNEPETNDKTLVLQIQKGMHAAFAELYTRYKQGVYVYCTRFLGDTPAAEDVFQDVFLHCFEMLKSGRDINNIRGYLLSSAHNRCLNFLRDHKHALNIDEIRELGSTHGNCDETITFQEMLQAVPAENREALILAEYHGYSYDEIAHMTSVPISTVRKRVFRARQQLRGLLSDNGNSRRGQQ